MTPSPDNARPDAARPALLPAIWNKSLRSKLDRLNTGRCLCGGIHGWSSDVMESGDGMPEIGIEECQDCGAIWDFGGDWPKLFREPMPTQQPAPGEPVAGAVDTQPTTREEGDELCATNSEKLPTESELNAKNSTPTPSASNAAPKSDPSGAATPEALWIAFFQYAKHERQCSWHRNANECTCGLSAFLDLQATPSGAATCECFWFGDKQHTHHCSIHGEPTPPAEATTGTKLAAEIRDKTNGMFTPKGGESDTPETDLWECSQTNARAALQRSQMEWMTVVPADVSRSLERRLHAAEAERDAAIVSFEKEAETVRKFQDALASACLSPTKATEEADPS